MIRQILIFFDCPQIRVTTDNYEYSFWFWQRRNKEWPNTILSLTRQLNNWNYEEADWETKTLYLKSKEFHWHLWTNDPEIWR